MDEGLGEEHGDSEGNGAEAGEEGREAEIQLKEEGEEKGDASNADPDEQTAQDGNLKGGDAKQLEVEERVGDFSRSPALIKRPCSSGTASVSK